MSTPLSKRTYHSESRRSQAVQTRLRVLSAARSLFQDKGFEGVTIEQIAQAAKVSVPTIYALFHSKSGILGALMDNALSTEQYEALINQVAQERSARGRLLLAAKIARQLYDAEKAQIEILRGVGVIAPELKLIEQKQEQRRYQRQEETIHIMIDEQVLPKDISATKAHDILWALTGRDMYRLLVLERGWNANEYEAWLAESLISLLLKAD